MSDEKKPAAPALRKLEDERTTYFLLPNDVHEMRIGRYYLSRKYGEEFKALIVSAIPVARLTQDHIVIPIVRKTLKPVSRNQPGPNGVPESYPVSDDELADGVTERGPVHVAKHWREGGEMGGFVAKDELREALNRCVGPFNVNLRDDEGLIRLGHT